MTAALTEEQAAATRHLRAVTARRKRVVEQAEADWREAVKAALATGLNGPQVAELAGIKKERVYQIRDGRR
jgi:hypothetical protein